MMAQGLLGLVVLVTVVFPAAALAGEQDFFAGLDVSGGTAFGSSSTTVRPLPEAGSSAM
jgi:hypothetical protein